MESEYFVEIDGPDGLKHHVGPFKTRAEAEAWIASTQFGARKSGTVSHADNNIIAFKRNERER